MAKPVLKTSSVYFCRCPFPFQLRCSEKKRHSGLPILTHQCPPLLFVLCLLGLPCKAPRVNLDSPPPPTPMLPAPTPLETSVSCFLENLVWLRETMTSHVHQGQEQVSSPVRCRHLSLSYEFRTLMPGGTKGSSQEELCPSAHMQNKTF